MSLPHPDGVLMSKRGIREKTLYHCHTSLTRWYIRESLLVGTLGRVHSRKLLSAPDPRSAHAEIARQLHAVEQRSP